MLNALKYADILFFGAKYWLTRFVLRKSIPFIGGFVLNETCNLKCAHCQVANRPNIKEPSFEESVNGLKTLYGLGARLLAITGGEPFHWLDADKNLESVVSEARNMGFRRIAVYTNGTFPLHSSADTVFVSIDGLRETSRKLRGDVYDMVLENIAKSPHNNIIINFTINALNQNEIEEFCRETAVNEKLKGVFFYFHTPYYGRDELFIDKNAKFGIIQRLLDLKRQRMPVLNSYSCLKAIASDSWKRPTNYCQVYSAGEIFECCRAIGNQDACDNCGYLGYTEIVQIMKLRPSAIAAGFNYI